MLAGELARGGATRPDGFVVEGPRAGGHNATPRGRLVLDDDGQPVFGPRDDADLAKVAAVGLPFWLAGGYTTAAQVREALATGAAGVQVGTLFALCEDSGLVPALRQEMLTELGAGQLEVRTDALASPTGFPFKVASLSETMSEADTCAARPPLCDLSYVRLPSQLDPGLTGHPCPADPVPPLLPLVRPRVAAFRPRVTLTGSAARGARPRSRRSTPSSWCAA